MMRTVATSLYRILNKLSNRNSGIVTPYGIRSYQVDDTTLAHSNSKALKPRAE
jgi:hypothetical protein